jgi:hypothetical protein
MVGNSFLSSDCGTNHDVCFPSLFSEEIRENTFKDQILTVILPFIYMATINYSKDVELEDENANDLFLTDEEKKQRRKIHSLDLLPLP